MKAIDDRLRSNVRSAAPLGRYLDRRTQTQRKRLQNPFGISVVLRVRIFGDTLGDPVADEILQALRARPEGMSRTDLSNLFGRNKRQARSVERWVSWRGKAAFRWRMLPIARAVCRSKSGERSDEENSLYENDEISEIDFVGCSRRCQVDYLYLAITKQILREREARLMAGNTGKAPVPANGITAVTEPNPVNFTQDSAPEDSALLDRITDPAIRQELEQAKASMGGTLQADSHGYSMESADGKAWTHWPAEYLGIDVAIDPSQDAIDQASEILALAGTMEETIRPRTQALPS